jgi:hypothetical protein
MKTTFCLIQDKYKYICLGLGQANKPVRLYSVHTVQCTMYTLYKPTAGNQFSCIVYTYSTAKLLSHMEAASPPRLDLSPGGPGRGQLTARPTTRWEGLISRVCLPFPSTGFPGLGGPREGTPPRYGQGSKQELLRSLTQTGWLWSAISQFPNRKENLS